MADVQKKLQADLEKYQQLQKDYQKVVSQRQQLDGQLNENTLVKEELCRLEEGANVYKMIGPVLVKQAIPESKQNVQKRIDYITGELKRHETSIKDFEKKQETCRESLAKYQQQIQQAQVKAAARS
ncbi:prefoldin subunit 6-like [Mizuhopecten yessoensis]|uniref:Prefoldin subunit 6 n=1 Tax=Mizuhopecten yessoensis TaxID=6573 RepID=A0A210QV38_MIZYE|nr:prefoldin subunit 6-like [Mizuhopecten yessoensis]OWF52576.1 Prefoldin subunit 6 [Mizuhopecten yessoensis]